MKTRITVTPLKHNGELESLSKLAAANNSGIKAITVNDVMGYIDVRSAVYPGLPMSYTHNGHTLQIEAENVPFIILSWEEVYELDMSSKEADLITELS